MKTKRQCIEKMEMKRQFNERRENEQVKDASTETAWLK
jgi:hypothetical protein